MKAQQKNVAAGVVGNVLEWYDFAVYGYMVPIISALFFPSENPTVSIIAAFSAFAAGYFARPLGGVMFGWIGDRLGRKAVLTISVTMMGVATVSIGFLPTYSQIGLAAPILLVMLRIFQGVSVGGEYTGSITFVLEHAPKEKRGWLTSWISVGGGLGFLIGSGVGAILTASFTSQELNDWAWRLPFLTGSVIAVLGFLMRRHLSEPEHTSRIAADQSPFIVAIRDHWRNMLQLMGLALSVNVMFYFTFVYVDDFLIETKGLDKALILTLNTAGLALSTALIPFFGWLSDRVGRRPILLLGSISILLTTGPIFYAFEYATITSIVIAQIVSGITIAMMFGVNPVSQSELLPEKVRLTGFSIAYGVVLATFGGTTPVVVESLIAETQWVYSPLPYLLFLCLVSVGTVFTIKESRPTPEPESVATS
jgi:MFS transporter, MHS family, proline/betaine transporter